MLGPALQQEPGACIVGMQSTGLDSICEFVLIYNVLVYRRPVASSRQRGAQDGLPTVTTLRGFIRTPASASQAGYSLEHEGVHKGSPSKDTFFSKSDKDFQSLGLLPELCEALSKLGYERPAHIQVCETCMYAKEDTLW